MKILATKTLTPEKLRRQQAKREKEILKWEKEKARPKKSYYFAYLVFIITLIYATDEIASQIGTLMKTEIANDLFSKFGQSSVSMLDLLTIVGLPFQVIGLLYRPLADRFGRKTFLIINTVGMSIALLVIFLSNNIFLYFIGACMVQFFIPHDMHVVYIMESSPSKHRAKFYSVIKFIANMSVMLIPVLRDALMADTSQWRKVYFIPAIIGLVTSFVAIFFARETDAFIDARIRRLKMTDEELAEEKAKKSDANAQGGLITALKFAMKHKQLRWLYITAAFLNIGFIASVSYQVIMSYGYAESIYGAFTDDIMNTVSLGPVTTALILFPFGSAVAQVIMGFISDGKGRKAAAITTAANCLLAFIGFWFGAKYNWNPYIVGFLCGAIVGSYYSVNDVIIIMVSESAPTNLRSSVMSAEFIVAAAGYAISYIANFIVGGLLGNAFIGTLAICLLVPGYIIGLFLLVTKTHDTKNVNLDTVTGTEWD